MKKILFLLSAIMLTACHSTYVDKNDYDPETYDYIPETEHEYLWQYSYSGITMAWKDFSDYQLTEKVRNKAVKKYGRNIMLRNVKLSDGRTPMIKVQEEEQRRIEERIARHEVWVGMSKDDLIRSRGEPTRATVENDGLASDMASVSVRGAAAVSSTTKANRVQVYYYSDAEIYIKDNVVIEVYDRR